mmetsp:Transcript_13791/g.45604  ORF Transcript_13791/g.45604 Transcript_13791/m.45604 type:complete len:207 (+) Transcript_13791:1695-2315(+)
MGAGVRVFEPGGVRGTSFGRDAPTHAAERNLLPVHEPRRGASHRSESAVGGNQSHQRRFSNGRGTRSGKHGERPGVRRNQRPERSHKRRLFGAHAFENVRADRERLWKLLGRRTAVALRRRRQGALRERKKSEVGRGGGSVLAASANHGRGKRVVHEQRQRKAAPDQRGEARRVQRVGVEFCASKKPRLLHGLDRAPADSRRGERR